jgi:hypothetical protein
LYAGETPQEVEKMDLKCPIDEVSFYKDVREFEELGIEPEVCPCDYCKVPSECPHKCMGGE